MSVSRKPIPEPKVKTKSESIAGLEIKKTLQAKEEMKRITLDIPKRLYIPFKKHCVENEVNMADVIRNFLEQFHE